MTTQKEAVNQQQDNGLNVQTIKINDKQSAALLVPEFQEDQKLAIVDEEVLNYLVNLLPEADTSEIVNKLITKLQRNGMRDLKVAVKISYDFVVFHKTVNLMERYFEQQKEKLEPVAQRQGSGSTLPA